jgi:hypothetical protein
VLVAERPRRDAARTSSPTRLGYGFVLSATTLFLPNNFVVIAIFFQYY